MRTLKSVTLAIALIIAIACGAVNFVTNLRLGIAAGAPVFGLLVQQGKITPELKNLLTTDLNTEAGYVSVLGNCFDAIPKGASDSKVRHLRCVQTFESQTRPLLQSHFKVNQTVSFIADDIEAVIQGAIIYYGGLPTGEGVTAGALTPVSEKEINRRIERLKKDLGQ